MSIPKHAEQPVRLLIDLVNNESFSDLTLTDARL